MHALYTLSVIVHVIAACAWIGGMVFFAAVLLPVLRREEHDAVRRALILSVGRRFRVSGWVSLGLLVVTGVSNVVLRGGGSMAVVSPVFWHTAFGHVLVCKLAFVALVLVSVATHDALASRSRRVSAWLGRAALLFSLAVVALAVWLVRGLPV
jgi:uncharacterized membrane protein